MKKTLLTGIAALLPAREGFVRTLAIVAALAAILTPAKAEESVTHRCRYSQGSTAAECTVPAAANYPLYKAGIISLYADRCRNHYAWLTPARIDEARKLWSTVPAANREAFVRSHERGMAESLAKYGNPALSEREDACATMDFLVMGNESPNPAPWRDYLTEMIEEGRK